MRRAKIVLVAASCSIACANVIGADFGEYRVDNTAANSHAATGGTVVMPGGGGASGQGGQVAGGAAGAGGIRTGSGGVLTGSGGIGTCSRRSCANVGTACGVVSDGCTGTIVCQCAAGECLQGNCCAPKAACDVGQCGLVSNGCNGTLDCAPCASCTPTADPTEVCDGADNDCDGTADNPGACPVNCVGYSFGGEAYMLCKTTRTWVDAQTDCVAHGMNLVVPDSSVENDWVKQTLTTAAVAEFWIGASDRVEEGSWRWLGGTRFWIGGATGTADSGRFASWGTSEPNDANGVEDCGGIRTTGWNDFECKSTRGYMCERFTVPAGCYDGVLNGSERDVDCGGSCGACPAGSACSVDADCDTQRCLNAVCVDPCKDGVKDGTETDVDCGGTCAKCAVNKVCSVNTDCMSATCTSGKCTGCVASACPACTVLATKCCKSDQTCGCQTLVGFPCQ